MIPSRLYGRYHLYLLMVIVLLQLFSAKSDGSHKSDAIQDPPDITNYTAHSDKKLNLTSNNLPSNQKRKSYDDKEQKKKKHTETQQWRIATVDEEEEMIVEKVCITSLNALISAFRFTAVFVRRTVDTIAGVISGLVKAVAGAFKLSADGIYIAAMHLAKPRAPDDRMPHFFEHVGRRVAKVLRPIASVFYGVSEACILTGETTEALTTGLGQAVEDSFRSLEFLCTSLQIGLTFLLHPHKNSSRLGDAFHERKRQAVLHTDVDNMNRNRDKNQNVLPLRFGVPINVPIGGSIQSSSNTKSGRRDMICDKQDDIEKGQNLPIDSIINDSINTTHIDESAEKSYEESDEQKETTTERLVGEPYIHPTSWFWFLPNFLFVDDSNSSRRIEEETHKGTFSLYLRSLFYTISRWEKYFEFRSSSNYMSYYEDVKSILLLLLHLFVSWIAGPWLSPIVVKATDGCVSTSTLDTELASEPSSIGPQLFFSLIVVAIVASMKYRSLYRKMLVIITLIVFLYLTIMASEHVDKSILATKVQIEAVNFFLQNKVSRGAITPDSKPLNKGVSSNVFYGDSEEDDKR